MRKALMRRGPGVPTLLEDPFFRRLNRFFDDDLLQPFASRGDEGLSPGWLPPVDVRETDDSYQFTVELPGLSKDEVDITLEDRVLTLSGERKFADEEKRNSFHRIERAYGSFSRSFTLPNQVDQAKVEARFQDGLLTISVPKAEQAKPRTIEIH